MTQILIDLPWPPTINHYYLRRGARTFISPKGLDYRNKVIDICKKYHGLFDGKCRLHMALFCYPPDNRKRDLDNLGKCICDSIQHAGVYIDDSQIDFLSFERMPEKTGIVTALIKKV